MKIVQTGEQFNEWYRDICEINEVFDDLIDRSDEATSNLNGTINRRNCLYWDNANTRKIEQKRVNLLGLTAQCGPSSRGIGEPFSFL